MMNLNQNLVKNNTQKILSFNLTSMIIIFLILSLITLFLLKNLWLSVGFTLVSVGYLVYIFIMTNKIKSIKDEKIS